MAVKVLSIATASARTRLAQDRQQALKQLDRETPVLLYCNSGQRSGMAKQLLDACGFSIVHNLGSYTCLRSGS